MYSAHERHQTSLGMNSEVAWLTLIILAVRFQPTLGRLPDFILNLALIDGMLEIRYDAFPRTRRLFDSVPYHVELDQRQLQIALQVCPAFGTGKSAKAHSHVVCSDEPLGEQVEVTQDFRASVSFDLSIRVSAFILLCQRIGVFIGFALICMDKCV